MSKNKKQTLSGSGTTQNRAYYGTKLYFLSVMRIALPVALQAMLQSSFSMVDQVMVGQLGSKSIAAVEIAGKPGFILTCVIGAVAAITGIMVSQYIGKKDAQAVSSSMSVNLLTATLLAACFAGFGIGMPGKITDIFSKDPNVTEIAATYLRIIALAYLPAAVSTILAVRVRCMECAAWPLYVSIVSALINTGLNWLLIFGHCGFPQLGVSGAAIASVISQVAGVILMILVYLRTVKMGTSFDREAVKSHRDGAGFSDQNSETGKAHLSFHLGKNGFRQYAAMLLPVVLNEFLWSVGQNVNTYVYGHLGTGELAAMALTGPVQGLMIGALSGISQAAGILVGKRLGEEAYEKGYEESKLLCIYGLAGAILLSLLLLVLRVPYTRIFHVEEDVRQIAQQLLLAFAVLAPVKVENMILGGGIVRSGGRTKYIMMVDMIGTWLIGVPLALFTGLVLHLPIVLVYFILSQEELVRLIITLFIFRGKKWMRTL